MKKGIFCVLVCMLMIVSTIIPVSGTTVSESTSYPLTTRNIFYVGGSGPNNYSRIQDAINDANFGDTVFVYSGIYKENLIILNSITLIGENKNTTIIDGQQLGNVIYIHSIEVTVKGFTIKNANGIRTAGVWLQHSYFTNISENIIMDNNYFSIFLNRSCFNTIIGNIISDEINVYVRSDFNKIKDNIISGGIGFFGKVKYNVIYQNVISNASTGIYFTMYCNQNIVMKNTLLDNDIGIRLDASRQNIILKNNFLNNQQDAYFYYTEPIQNNLFLGNYWNQSLPLPKIIYGERHAFYAIRNDFWSKIEEIDWHPAQKPYDIGI